jgi:N-methylhydantoinase A
MRKAWFREAGGEVETMVYDLDTLRAGEPVRGPALFEIPLTSIVVPPGWRATLTRYGNVFIETAASGAARG